MKIGVYPGSFDPLTNGHLDIIERAKQICDKVIVAIGINSEKQPLFTIDERLEMLEKCCFCPKNKIEAAAFDGLLVEYCRNRRAHFIVRGIRAFIDFEYEYAVYLMNKRLASEIDTIFLMARSEYSFISSNMVKEVARYGGDISTLVPSFVNQKLIEKNSR